MSYFNVFFQAAICHSWFPAAKLRLKKQSYGNNCDRRILKNIKRVWGMDFVFSRAIIAAAKFSASNHSGSWLRSVARAFLPF